MLKTNPTAQATAATCAAFALYSLAVACGTGGTSVYRRVEVSASPLECGS